MPITPTEKIWMNDELVDWQDAKIHVLTHSLHYGLGVFEGIRAYSTKKGPAVFRLDDHITRLINSAKIFGLEMPYSHTQLKRAVIETLSVNKLDSGYIRPIVFLGYGEMGLNPLTSKVNVAIAVWPWGTYLGDEGLEKGVRVKISSWRRHDPNVMPGAAKGTGMYINSCLAKVEALKAGYDEAILLNPQGFVAECTGENIFIVKDAVLITPPISLGGALEGITRDTVIKLALDLGFGFKEAALVRSDLYVADEAFLTGTAAEVVPISSVDDRPVGSGNPGEITKKLQQAYFALVKGEDDHYKDWLSYVNE
jgi:branched-chain amino acid aminotransferase